MCVRSPVWLEAWQLVRSGSLRVDRPCNGQRQKHTQHGRRPCEQFLEALEAPPPGGEAGEARMQGLARHRRAHIRLSEKPHDQT